MIAVTIGNNLKRARFNFNPNTTIRQALENTAGETGIDYSAGMLSLDGSTIGGARPGQDLLRAGLHRRAQSRQVLPDQRRES